MKNSDWFQKFETFFCANFQKFETFIRVLEQVLQRTPRAGAAASSRHAPGARRRRARPRQRLSRSPPAGTLPAPLRRLTCLVHDGTQLRKLPERPVSLQHEAKRARVCQVQELHRIVPRRLQRVCKSAEHSPGQLLIEAEQCQCRVARV